MTRGVLVAFEGIDGSGKTTQAGLLCDWLTRAKVDFVRTKEPTAGPWGQKIRQSKFDHRMSLEEELECFVNDRKEHVQTLLEPSLARGAVVVVDRYYYSTVAYQGARGVDPKALLVRNRAFAPRPDLVVLLDIDPKVGLERIHKRGEGQDLFENEAELARARAIFLSLAEPHVLRLDAQKTPAELHRAILTKLASIAPTHFAI